VTRGATASAAALYAVLVAALFWRAVLGIGVLTVPAGSLFAPWNTGVAAGRARAFANPELHDLARVFFAWQRYARRQVRSGHFPSWNPYVGSGTPFFANPQTQVASPFSIALYLLPFPYGLAAMAFLRVWIAALGAFVFARRLGCSYVASFVAGVAFGGSGFETVWAAHPLAGVFALLPWILTACEGVRQRGRRRDVALLAVAVAVAGAAGHPGSFADVLFALALYAIISTVVQAHSIASLVGPIARTLAGVAIGVALAAVALLPAYFALRGTIGLQERSGGGLALPLSAARTLFYPFWWGRPPSGEFGRPPLNANERTVFVGLVPLLLAVTALGARERWRLVCALTALLIVAGGATYGIAPIDTVVRALPGVGETPVRRLQAVIELALAVLAAVGLDCLRRRFLALLLLGAAAVGLVALVLIGHDDVSSVFSLALRRALPADARSAAAAAVGWSLVVALAAGVVLASAWRRARLVSVLLALVCLADVGTVAYGYQQTPPASLAFQTTPPSINYLQAHAADRRITGLWDTLPPDTAMLYGLRDIREYDPPQPSLAYARTFHLINPARIGFWLSVAGIRTAGRPLLNLLDVRYVIGPPNRPAPRGPATRLVYSGADAKIVENLQASTRVSIPSAIIGEQSARAVVAALGAPGFPATGTVVMVGRARAGRGRARITHDGATRVEILAHMRRGGLVVLADTAARGWRVTIDGKTARPLTVDGVARGVVVPPGTHLIAWSYSVPGLRDGLAITLAAACLLVALLVPPPGSIPRRLRRAASRTARLAQRPAARPDPTRDSYA
jgi:Bacterial membrane protein YfhO